MALTGVWNLLLTPAKKNIRAELEEELETREGIGLRRGAESPCLELGRWIGIGADQPDLMDLDSKFPLSAIPSTL